MRTSKLTFKTCPICDVKPYIYPAGKLGFVATCDRGCRRFVAAKTREVLAQQWNTVKVLSRSC